jgi:glycosyltransferase involved in cell wall biosynthesis
VKNPRILYVCCERIVPGGAAATHVHEICDGLARRGYGVTLQAEHGGSRNGLVGQLGRYARIIAASLARLPRTDIVYFRSHFAAFPIALAARLLGKAMVQEINGVYADVFVTHPRFAGARRLLSWMQRQQYRWADALVAVTPQLAAWGAEQAGHERSFTIANGANTAIFTPHGPRTERPRPYALFFGGMTRWHGIDTMLTAVHSPAWPEALDLVLAGPMTDASVGPLLRGAPANVSWLRAVPQHQLPELIRGAVAALVPISDPQGRSSFGVVPLKLFESLACGTPVIVTDLPGQADLVRAGPYGVVIPVDDGQALADAVRELAADPERARAMGEAGARLIAAEHSWDARAAETARVIEGVVRR